MDKIKRISIVCGHYGTGKTNFSVNLAINLAKEGKSVCIIDLDVVNPYFKTADFKELFEEYNIKLLSPVFTNTNLDIPVLPEGIIAAINNTEQYLIIDVGGDETGATALGGFSAVIKNYDYDLYYVINEYRYFTKTVEENVELIQKIEHVSRLKATKIINNSNLGNKTSVDDVRKSFDFAENLAKQANLPMVKTLVEEKFVNDFNDIEKEKLFAIKIYVKSIWE